MNDPEQTTPGAPVYFDDISTSENSYTYWKPEGYLPEDGERYAQYNMEDEKKIMMMKRGLSKKQKILAVVLGIGGVYLLFRYGARV